MSVMILFQDGPAVSELELDAAPSQTHAGENDVTDHPVEQGAAITDHVRVKPDTLTIEGVITNAPMSGNASGLDLVGAGYTQLRAFKEAGQLLKVATSLRTYENMVVTSLSAPRAAGSAGMLRFTCAFKQVRVAKSQRVDVTDYLRAKQKKTDGKKSGQAAENQVDNRTALATIDDLSGRVISGTKP